MCWCARSPGWRARSRAPGLCWPRGRGRPRPRSRRWSPSSGWATSCAFTGSSRRSCRCWRRRETWWSRSRTPTRRRRRCSRRWPAAGRWSVAGARRSTSGSSRVRAPRWCRPRTRTRCSQRCAGCWPTRSCGAATANATGASSRSGWQSRRRPWRPCIETSWLEFLPVSEAKRVMIIGLDCAAPKILFDDMRSELPVISGLMERGVWGELESCDPPITVPAWSCMMSSKDPGTLGFYGFRNRKDHSYDGMTFATNEKMKHDRVWDILSRDGRHVVVLGVPMTFPPRQVNGEMISCFLAPSIESRYTYPEELRDEIAETVGEYMVDVPNFRTDEKERIMRDIKEMTRRRFALARHLRDTRDWDFLMMVEMGTDRLHHGFWRFYDHDHPDYQPGTRWEDEFRAYYRSA